jgi:hypothetical protein
MICKKEKKYTMGSTIKLEIDTKLL